MKSAKYLFLFVSMMSGIAILPVRGQELKQPETLRPRYSVSTEVTVEAVVTEVKTFHSGLLGTHLIVRAGGETLDVHLGTNPIKIKFFPGDVIEVIGSRTTYHGTPLLLARRVRKGSQIQVLRNARGFTGETRVRRGKVQ